MKRNIYLFLIFGFTVLLPISFGLELKSDLSFKHRMHYLYRTDKIFFDKNYYRTRMDLARKTAFVNTHSINAKTFIIRREYFMPIKNETPLFLTIEHRDIKDQLIESVHNMYEIGWRLEDKYFLSIVGEPTHDKSYLDFGYLFRYVSDYMLMFRFEEFDYQYNVKTRTENEYDRLPTLWSLDWYKDDINGFSYANVYIITKSSFNQYISTANFDEIDSQESGVNVVYLTVFNKGEYGVNINYIYKLEENINISDSLRNYKQREHMIDSLFYIKLELDKSLSWFNYFMIANYSSEVDSDNKNVLDYYLKTFLSQSLSEHFSLEYGLLYGESLLNKDTDHKLLTNFSWMLNEDSYIKLVNSWVLSNGINFKWDGSGVTLYYVF